MRNDVITPVSGQYFFWILAKKQSFVFCEPPQKKSSFIKRCRGLHEKAPL